MQAINLGEPCRNFCVLAVTSFRDPRDGREKVALASDVSGGGVGRAILIDPDGTEGESYTFPGDSGAFSVLNLHDEALLFGTCHHKGYLLRLDLENRTWAEPLRDDQETYIWQLCMGADGMVYGGTYPGCALLRYDPLHHTLENLGRVSENPKNLYTLEVYTLPNHILVSCGTDAPHFAAWDLAKECMYPVGSIADTGHRGFAKAEVTDEYLCLKNGDMTEFFDPKTLAPIAQPKSYCPPEPATPLSATFSDGRQVIIQGQDYCVRRPGRPDTPFQEIPVPRPATGIMTLIADPEGNLWGSSAFGQTIFRYEPATGEYWNSGAVCIRSGEVYGMALCRDRLFLAAYAGGDLIVYDPQKPWNQRDNVNPHTIGNLDGKLVRPFGKSVVGPDGAVWTGWAAQYGVYGGGLSRVDPETLEIASWYDPIPGQSIIGVACDASWIYFITSGITCGLAPKVEPLHFAVWDTKGEIVRQHQFAAGINLTGIRAAYGVVVMSAGNEIHIFDSQTMQFTGRIDVGEPCYSIQPFGDGRFAAFCGYELLLLNPQTATFAKLCDLPERDIATAVVTPQGELYFAAGSHLYRIGE